MKQSFQQHLTYIPEKEDDRIKSSSELNAQKIKYLWHKEKFCWDILSRIPNCMGLELEVLLRAAIRDNISLYIFLHSSVGAFDLIFLFCNNLLQIHQFRPQNS